MYQYLLKNPGDGSKIYWPVT